jgi:hypothetical protein
MNVRGVAFLARRSMGIAEHGPAAWTGLMQKVTAKYPIFKQELSPISLIPAEDFIGFNELLIATFHGGDRRAYWTFGQQSAVWSLTQGPNKSLWKPGEYRRFMFSGSAVWASYFDAGAFKVVGAKGYTDVTITEVPVPHPYFELAVMGYLAGGLAQLGAHGVRHEALRGFTLGHPDVHYRFWVE